MSAALDRPTVIRVDQPPRPGRPSYVAAVSVDVRTGRVVDAAPIMRWAIGKDWDTLKERGRVFARRWKGWIGNDHEAGGMGVEAGEDQGTRLIRPSDCS